MECSHIEATTDLQRQVLQSTLQEVAARDEAAVDCCVICLETISEPCELVPCGHDSFDYICVLSWLSDKPVCPLCKGNVPKVLHGPPDCRTSTTIEPKPLSGKPAPATRSNPFSLNRNRHRPPFRRRQDREPGQHASRATNLATGLAHRREVYLHQRYSKHVGANRVSLYRELTPAMFCTDKDLVSRARMWVRRELQVFSFLNPDEADTTTPARSDADRATATDRRRSNNAEFLLEYIIAILKTVDIMGSAGQAEDMLSDFLGRDNTRLFLHELRAWLRSPYNKLEDWDRAVQYDPIIPRETGSHETHGRGEEIHIANSRREGDRPRGDFYTPDYPRRASGKRQPSQHQNYRRKRYRGDDTGVYERRV